MAHELSVPSGRPDRAGVFYESAAARVRRRRHFRDRGGRRPAPPAENGAGAAPSCEQATGATETGAGAGRRLAPASLITAARRAAPRGDGVHAADVSVSLTNAMVFMLQRARDRGTTRQPGERNCTRNLMNIDPSLLLCCSLLSER